MTPWLLALLTFAAGASLTRLITKDSLFEGLRDRWVGHFKARQEQVLVRAEAAFPVRDVAIAKYITELASHGAQRRVEELSRSERTMALLREIGDRAEDEPPVSWYVMGKARVSRRPWSRVSAKLVRIRGYMEFISCPWCVSFWVFLAVWVAAWGLVLGFAAEVLGLPFWVALPVLAMAYRWVYALLAMHLDKG